MKTAVLTVSSVDDQWSPSPSRSVFFLLYFKHWSSFWLVLVSPSSPSAAHLLLPPPLLDTDQIGCTRNAPID